MIFKSIMILIKELQILIKKIVINMILKNNLNFLKIDQIL
jgi:hypothetical protein